MLTTLRLVLPALIPSWRFFKTVAPSPRVEFRVEATEGPGPWQEAAPRPVEVSFARMMRRMFWNPRWNEALYLNSCAERLIGTEERVHETEILRRIARALSPEARFQYRLIFVTREGGQLERHMLYESPWVVAGPLTS